MSSARPGLLVAQWVVCRTMLDLFNVVFAKAGPSSLVTEGRVFTVRRDGEVLGYLQAAALKAMVGTTLIVYVGARRFREPRVQPCPRS
jgi:hypothetical protein